MGLDFVGKIEKVLEGSLFSRAFLHLPAGDQAGRVFSTQQHHHFPLQVTASQSSCRGKKNHHNHEVEHFFNSSLQPHWPGTPQASWPAVNHEKVNSQLSPWVLLVIHNRKAYTCDSWDELCLMNSSLSLSKTQCFLNILLAMRLPWDRHLCGCYFKWTYQNPLQHSPAGICRGRELFAPKAEIQFVLNN